MPTDPEVTEIWDKIDHARLASSMQCGDAEDVVRTVLDALHIQKAVVALGLDDGNLPSTASSTAVEEAWEEQLPPRGPMRPDWIMVGVPLLARREVLLLAGNDIRRASLERNCINIGQVMYSRQAPRYDAHISVMLGEVIETIAEDYPAAIRKLMEGWTPAAAERLELES